MSYNASNYTEQGGAVTVIGGELRIASGATITAAGTQASYVADVATTGVYADDDDAIVAAINALKDALVGAGIMAAS
jgi:hypothetical protein